MFWHFTPNTLETKQTNNNAMISGVPDADGWIKSLTVFLVISQDPLKDLATVQKTPICMRNHLECFKTQDLSPLIMASKDELGKKV